MPARDRYHEHVRAALTKDGWTITHDPLRLRWGARDLYVDLGVERLLAAEKGERRIAIEIKSFQSLSDMADLEGALGQYVLYNGILRRTDPERDLYLAVSGAVFDRVFEEPIGKLALEDSRIRLLVFDPDAETIRRWIP